MTFDDEDALITRLVRAGQADGPSARALSAAPVAVAALLASTAAQAALAPAAAVVATEAGRALSPLVLVKWIAVGTVAGTSLMAVVHAPELLGSKHVAKTVAAAQSAPAAPAQAKAPAALARPTPSPAAEPASASSTAAGVTSAPHPDVAREVSVLDAARHALVEGHAAEALRLLTALERLPGRALVPEATVLRVRALLAQGSNVEARRVTDAFCANAASSPQCAVLRGLIANNVIQPTPPRL
jgi:hypothetical protein